MENVNQNNLDSERLREEKGKRKIREEEEKESLEKHINEIQSISDLSMEEEISLFKQIVAQGKEAQALKAFHDYEKVNSLLFGKMETGELKPAEKLFQAYKKLAIDIIQEPMKNQRVVTLKKIYVDDGIITTLTAIELAEDSIRYAIRDLALQERASSTISSEEEKKKIEMQGFKIEDIPEEIYNKVDKETIELFRDYLRTCVYNGLHGFTLMRKRHLRL